MYRKDLLNDLGNRIVSLNLICRYTQGRYIQSPLYCDVNRREVTYIDGYIARQNLTNTLELFSNQEKSDWQMD